MSGERNGWFETKTSPVVTRVDVCGSKGRREFRPVPVNFDRTYCPGFPFRGISVYEKKGQFSRFYSDHDETSKGGRNLRDLTSTFVSTLLFVSLFTFPQLPSSLFSFFLGPGCCDGRNLDNVVTRQYVLTIGRETNLRYQIKNTMNDYF